MPARGRHVRDPRFAHPVLVPVRAGVVAPVQAGVVDLVPVPRLEDVDFAVLRPGERLGRQQPAGGPDAGRAGRGEHSGEAAAAPRQSLVRAEPCAGVLVAGRGRVSNGAQDQPARGSMEGVRRMGDVVLELVVAPAMGSDFVGEVLGHGYGRGEGGLPVGTGKVR